MRRPKVDPDKCTGDQVCVTIAPDVFEMNEERKAYVKDPEGADEETIQHAIRQGSLGSESSGPVGLINSKVQKSSLTSS